LVNGCEKYYNICMDKIRRNVKRILVEGLGWILVLVGIAALVLPGPGLLAIFAGMALLSTQYEWAERRLDPVRKAALKTAADSVRTWPRIIMSTLFACAIIGVGITWGLSPAVPSWWPIADKWWLIGGWGTGATMIGSGIIALAMIIYSYVAFRPKE
jgi:uncharacterized protein (TIGR02611 family)